MSKLTNLGTNVPEQPHVPEMPEPRKRDKKRMKVKDFINLLRTETRVEIRRGNNFLCLTKTDCEGVTPYLDEKINNWFVDRGGVSVVIDLEEEEA